MTVKNQNSPRLAAERKDIKRSSSDSIDLIVAPSTAVDQANLNINVKVAGGAA